jgi:hypothetical protein
VPGAGIEPAQYEVPRDFKCEHGNIAKACVIKDFLISRAFSFINLVGKC